MIEVQQDFPLAPLTTFKIGGPAQYYCKAKDQDEVREAVEFARKQGVLFFVLGGGSNMVVNDAGFKGLVIHPDISGIEVAHEDDETVLVKVGAGESWDGFVALAVQNGWWGIENLSHIPGSCGAVAVQNVGAYGQEAKDTVSDVFVVDTQNLEPYVISSAYCRFAYRSSIFNTEQKGRFVILSTLFRLRKNGQPNLAYKDLRARFDGQAPALADIRNAVIEIRNGKFPYPREAVNGNAGSFFKNPIVPQVEFSAALARVVERFGAEAAEKLQAKSHADGDCVKVPAAFLIDICGLKNVAEGGAAINENQPLVIINRTGTATARDVLALAERVKATVKEKTGIQLFQEPELVGF